MAAQTLLQVPLSEEELEREIASGAARVICGRDSFRLVVCAGLKYHCALQRFQMWAEPAGNRDSDFRGTKVVWKIKKVEPDTGYQRKSSPQPTITVEELEAKLRAAIATSSDGRWAREHWSLVSPANITMLLNKIDKLSTAA